MRSLILAVTALASGCYRPSVAACQYSCAAGELCPSGLVCNTGTVMCVENASDPCPAGGSDANGDTPPPGDATDAALHDGACMWAPSNVPEACAKGADMLTGLWQITTPTTIDITNATSSVDPVINGSSISGSHLFIVDSTRVVVAVGTFHILQGASLTVIGKKPFILLAANTALVEGAIDYSGVSTSPPCLGAGGQGGHVNGISGGGGGGGGSFGSGNTGSIGATGVIGAGGVPGSPTGAPNLIPLELGCFGGASGGNQSVVSVAGGAGGGAIEISAQVDVKVGVAPANGGGGQIAVNGAAGASDMNFSNPGGGGGGGAGGAILLEGASVDVTATAHLCANGGGGGANSMTVAQPGQCSEIPAMGTVGGGGQGATGTVLSGPGTATTGGGGGGGVGRIHLAAPSITVDTSAVVTPGRQ